MKPANSIFARLPTTVFTVMSQLATEHQAINLGQGFPDDNGPDDVREKAAQFLHDQPNQYPPMMGVPELRDAVAAHAKRFYGLDVDGRSEVMVTSGATEALTACLLGLIEPGDEVVVIEPVYDSYVPVIRRAGGVARAVRLTPPAWDLPRADLAAAFGPKTKLLMLNSPMNPCGRVFNREELAFIADLLARHDAMAICDEVYEHIVFDGQAHIPLMTLPRMRERCLRIGSAGKTFSLTGWKVGYVTGAPDLLAPCAKAHQFLTFTTPPNLQRAVAYGLAKETGYFRAFAQDMQKKRDLLADGLARIGFGVLPSAGSYFVTTDIMPLGFTGGDAAFCETITREAKVAAIPISAFYESGGPSNLVRFAFCKKDELLRSALDRLARHFT